MHVDAEALQARLAGARARRPGCRRSRARPGPSGSRRMPNFVARNTSLAPAADGAADQLLVGVRAVDVGRCRGSRCRDRAPGAGWRSTRRRRGSSRSRSFPCSRGRSRKRSGREEPSWRVLHEGDDSKMRAMLINCVAYEDGTKLADIPVEDISDYLRPARLLRLGRAEGCDARGARRDAGRVRPARPGGRGRAPRPPAAEDRGVRRHAVRRAAHGGARRRPTSSTSARSTSSSARTSCSRCATAASRASSACARAPSASRSCCATARASCFYALMDAVVDRYFPIIDALEIELEAIEAQIFEPRRRPRQHRAAVRAEAAQDGHASSTRWRRCSKAWRKLVGGRVPQVCADDAASTSATSSTT